MPSPPLTGLCLATPLQWTLCCCPQNSIISPDESLPIQSLHLHTLLAEMRSALSRPVSVGQKDRRITVLRVTGSMEVEILHIIHHKRLCQSLGLLLCHQRHKPVIPVAISQNPWTCLDFGFEENQVHLSWENGNSKDSEAKNVNLTMKQIWVALLGLFTHYVIFGKLPNIFKQQLLQMSNDVERLFTYVCCKD